MRLNTSRAAQSQAKAVELRNTLVMGFLRKVTPAARNVFRLQHRTKVGGHRKRTMVQPGKLTIEQRRFMTQKLLGEVHKGDNPSAAKAAARKAPTLRESSSTFWRTTPSNNKPNAQRRYQRCH